MGSSPQPSADPVLDLLGKMESQISRIETTRPESSKRDARPSADSPELHSLREELAQAEQRGAMQLALFTEALARLRTQIPELVEDVIASRFHDVEERFYTQVREIQQRTMDSFLQSAQARVGTRMATLESTLAEQTASMAEMRENYIKSDRNIDRLLQGIDRLTLELMRLSTLAGAPIVTRRVSQLSPVTSSSFAEPIPEARPVYAEPPPGGRRANLQEFVENDQQPTRYKKLNRPAALFVPALIVILVLGAAFVGWQVVSGGGGFRFKSRQSASAAPGLSSTDDQIKTASEFATAKDYAKAESIYRNVLRGEPDNRTAIKELASMLFKQQKYEEAAAVLKALPPGS